MPQYFTPEQIAHYAKAAQPSQEKSAQTKPKDKTLFRAVGLPVFVGGQAADTLTTMKALNSGRFEEGNPLLPDSPAGIAAIKAATTGLGAYGLDKLAGKHNTLALLLALLGGGVGIGAAVHNAKAMKPK